MIKFIYGHMLTIQHVMAFVQRGFVDDCVVILMNVPGGARHNSLNSTQGSKNECNNAS